MPLQHPQPDDIYETILAAVHQGQTHKTTVRVVGCATHLETQQITVVWQTPTGRLICAPLAAFHRRFQLASQPLTSQGNHPS